MTTVAASDPFAPLDESERARSRTAPKRGADQWRPILPVPDDAPPPPVEHPELGLHVASWRYADAKGRVLAYERRFLDADGGKETRPLSYCEHAETGGRSWRWKAPPAPRPLYGLDRLADSPETRVLVCEGPKAAEAAAARWPDLVGVATFGGAGGAGHTDVLPLRGRDVVVWPDHDEPGERYASEIASAALAAGAARVRVVRVPAGLPVGWDLADSLPEGWEAERLRALLDSAEEAPAPPVGAGDATWPAPLPLPPKTCPAPPLPEELLPEVFRPWLVDAAERACLPLEFVAIPALVAAGSALGREVGIHPKRRDTGWRVVPNVWGAIVGRPGVLKSPAVEEGLSPLAPLIERAAARFEEKRLRIDAERAGIELRLRGLRSPRKRRAGGADELASGREIAELERELRETVAVERRYKTHDATVEKLGELLAQNPRGLLLVRDELAGWLHGLEKKGREGERAFFLEAWSGTGSFDFDRIGRGTLHVPSLCMSVMGSIQPGRLRPFLEEALGERSGADGLMQRFQLLVWPDTTPEWRSVDREPDAAARARVDRVFDALDRVKGRALAGVSEGTALGPLAIPCLRFAPEAQALFDVWRDGLERRLREPAIEQTPAFASHLAKYRSLMPSLALVFALVDGAEGGFVGIGGGVPLEAAQRAAAWCEYLEQHARKLYAVELNPAATAAHALARRIRDRLLHDGMTLRDVERAEWSGLTRGAAVRDGLEILERHRWLRLERRVPGPEGGRPSVEIRVNPAVLEVTP